MISLLISILYAIVIFIYVLTSFFIIYHLVKYAASSEIKTIMLLLFIVIAVGLLSVNLLVFFSIDWNSLLYKLNL